MTRQLEFWDDEEHREDAAPRPSESPSEDKGDEKYGWAMPQRSTSPGPSGHPLQSGTWDGHAVETAVEGLRGELCRLCGMDVLVRITNNSHCMMRVAHAPCGRGARLSVHWMFLDAPQAVVKALAGWVKSPQKLRTNSLLKCYMRENTDRIPAAKERRITIKTKGRHYDLAELYGDVNAAEFDGKVNAQITWGVMQPVGGSRSGHFRLGSYTDAKNLIRIHPVLDNAEVPHFVVRSIVFHEMLHAFLGIEKEDGKRRKIHHAAFTRREQQYDGHEAAEAWIKNPKNIRLLAKIRKCGGVWIGPLHSDP